MVNESDNFNKELDTLPLDNKSNVSQQSNEKGSSVTKILIITGIIVLVLAVVAAAGYYMYMKGPEGEKTEPAKVDEKKGVEKIDEKIKEGEVKEAEKKGNDKEGVKKEEAKSEEKKEATPSQGGIAKIEGGAAAQTVQPTPEGENKITETNQNAENTATGAQQDIKVSSLSHVSHSITPSTSMTRTSGPILSKIVHHDVSNQDNQAQEATNQPTEGSQTQTAADADKTQVDNQIVKPEGADDSTNIQNNADTETEEGQVTNDANLEGRLLLKM